MATVITVNDGTGTTVSPTLVLGYATARESQNIVHDIVGGGIAVTIIRPRPRSGTLELFFTEETPAFAALEVFARESTFTLSDTDRPSVNMTYVINGTADLALDSSRKRWTLSAGYQEVEIS